MEKCLKCFFNNFEGFERDEQVDGIRHVAELANVLELEVEVDDIQKLWNMKRES